MTEDTNCKDGFCSTGAEDKPNPFAKVWFDKEVDTRKPGCVEFPIAKGSGFLTYPEDFDGSSSTSE